jgi:ABC-2 type transport system permease protein
MRNVWTIARREYSHYFSTPISYAVACAILLIVGLIFAITVYAAFQSAFQGGGLGGAAPDIKGVSGTFTFMLVLSVPALTMRLISDENRMGTIELLLTAPVQDWELIVGKWLGGFLFILTVLAVTLIYPLILNFFLVSPGIDQGLMMSAYLGLILVSAAFLAIGVGVSSLFSNQVASFFVTLMLFVVLWWMFGFLSQYLQGNASNIFSYLDMGAHFNNSLNQGTINLSDIVYYLSLTALGLALGTAVVEARRWS